MIKESGHWYNKEGEACHTIESKNGKLRPTTLRDARKFNWYPSVTTLMKVLAAPELDRWKQQQVLIASLTLPRNEGETDDQYCSRIMEDAFKQVGDAADLGTAIHKALEDHFQGQAYDPAMEQYIAPVKAWAAEKKVKFLKHELRLVNHEIGYAGTTDALIEVDGILHILDYKSRKTKGDLTLSHGQKNQCRYQHMLRSLGQPVELTCTSLQLSLGELPMLGTTKKQYPKNG